MSVPRARLGGCRCHPAATCCAPRTSPTGATPSRSTVADLAAAARLSPAHFSREFRRAFGESPHQYLLTRRLERAASLLRSTDWSVAGSASRSG